MRNQVVGVLTRIFEQRKQRNPKYSLRSYARDLKISPGRLSRILNDKDEPGPKFVEALLKTKSFGDAEREEIRRSLDSSKNPFTHARDNDEIVMSAQELKDAYYIMAIYSLLNSTRREFSEGVICQRLGFEKAELKRCLEFLLKVNAVRKNPDGSYQSLGEMLLLPRKQAPQLYASHVDFLKVAFENLSSIQKGEFFVGNLVVALTDESAKKIKKILTTTMAKITKEAKVSGEKSVYHLTTQLFPIDRGD